MGMVSKFLDCFGWKSRREVNCRSSVILKNTALRSRCCTLWFLVYQEWFHFTPIPFGSSSLCILPSWHGPSHWSPQHWVMGCHWKTVSWNLYLYIVICKNSASLSLILFVFWVKQFFSEGLFKKRSYYSFTTYQILRTYTYINLTFTAARQGRCVVSDFTDGGRGSWES